MTRALNIINRAVSGEPLRGRLEVPVAATSGTKSQTSGSRQGAPTSVRDLLEQLAGEHDLVYMPRDGKSPDGKALYSFGKIAIFVDREVVFAKAPGDDHFMPLSLDELVAKAKQ